ncbi:MAG TPA: VWA domain-containing protein [Polyangiaceae bacterium]|nr:VWA domain-containing protein [Polyangiaceae bacterium]
MALFTVACSSSETTGTGHGPAPVETPADGGTAVADGGPPRIPAQPTDGAVLILGCGADCVAPRRCSIASATCLYEGACLADGDCDGGKKCNSSGVCEVGGDCGQTTLEIEKVPPNIMLLLDRSGSMNGDAGGDTRWNVAKSAIGKITSALGANIRFGLATYSSCEKGGCSAGSVVVPIAPDNATAVETFLASTTDQRSSDGKGLTSDGKLKYLCDSGDPETSTGKSLSALTAEPSLMDPARTNAVILLTDGKENDECKGDCDGACGAGKLLAQSPPVKTYVVGLGVSASALDAIAEAGGTTSSIATDDLGQLSGAFDTITSSVDSCEYTVGTAPPDTDGLYVFFDKAPVSKDPANGWSYASAGKKLEFNGKACDQLRAGSVTNVDVVYACAPPILK